MTVIRKNVYELGGNWAEPILWYARGVKAMKARALNDKTSWRFYGAMHGIDRDLWQQYGYLSRSDAFPAKSDTDKYWDQCQHGSWYFLPWHRGYLIAFEAIVRDAVVKAGGPSTWTLPYWNYFKPNQNALPPAFASADWPDGHGNNPLFVKQRFGPQGNGKVFVPLTSVNLNALDEREFTGVASGGSPGFGGVDTGFHHSRGTHGRIERQPHDLVHSLVGGAVSDDEPGLMSDPDTAGLDPIFWLHHANIDRLWEVWRRNPPGKHHDPDKTKWKNGPAPLGQRKFVMPKPDGQEMVYTPGEMSDLTRLGYTYDDLSSPTARPLVARRMERLGVQGAAALNEVEVPPMAKTVELLGASSQNIRVSGSEARASVALDPATRNKVTNSITSAAALARTGTPREPDRVFLNLENVRGSSDATVLDVYINVPEGAKPTDYPDHMAGSVALFGVRKASKGDSHEAGDGLTFVVDITKVVDTLHLANNFDVSKLDVRLVPTRPVSDAAQISIGRIGVFREGE